MAARTPREAVEEFLEPFTRAALCLTPQPLLASGRRPSDDPYSFSFVPRNVPVRLGRPDGRRRVDLFIGHLYLVDEVDVRPDQRWRARSVGYAYDVLDRDGREILTYHWHPEVAEPDFAHLHLSGRMASLDLGAGDEPVALGDMHLPTDHVTFAAIARLLIVEFGVESQRPDWESVLSSSDEDERSGR